MRRSLLGATLFSVVAGCSFDPERAHLIDSLGDEKPGVPPGPLHRSGQPCVACHDGGGPGSSVFSFGGTVYQSLAGPAPLSDALVRFIDATGRKYETGTNCGGNFFVMKDDYNPSFPVWVKLVFGMVDGKPANFNMGSPIYREGSCTKCHADAPGRESVGHVYISENPIVLPSRPCTQ